MYSGSSLLADWNVQSVSGLYKNFTRMSPSEFAFLINLIGSIISKKFTAFRKAISVQERLALTLRFLASGDSYVSLQYLFKISKQAISCIVPEVCEALVENLKDYIQVRQILLLFVVDERSLKLHCNQNLYLNTNFTGTLLLKTGQIILQTPVYFLLKMSWLAKCFLWENCEAEVSYCTD